MDTEGSEIREARKIEARKAWNAALTYARQHNVSVKRRLEFDQVYERLESDCNSLADVARDMGVTCERARQLYNRYFRSIFNKSPRKRMHICTAKRYTAMLHVPPHPSTMLGIVVQQATALGLPWRLVPGANNHPRYQQYHQLVINNRCCFVIECTVGFSPKDSAAVYARFRLPTRREWDILICVVHVEGYPTRLFIIPRDEVALTQPLSVYVTLRNGKQTTKPRASWRLEDYENAWLWLTDHAHFSYQGGANDDSTAH